MRRPVIGVMGGGAADDATCAVAQKIGRLVAERDWVMLSGGRDVGVMQAAAKAAREVEGKGLVVGVLPSNTDAGASPNLDLAIITGMRDARNVINVLSSDVIIACLGAMGTISEIALALKNGKPVILVGWELNDAPFRPYRDSGALISVDTPEEAIAQVAILLSTQMK